ncbi:NucA/NucB deoxyribonuclease domain-containing protein [Microtetraspora malaysiensis]|uniref:NucA/NucB deoxyribonuclease domain-containing protein n=1 Tax=Microtetraspora malaysiensis TaxID=161358 RepID=UPI003D8A7B98
MADAPAHHRESQQNRRHSPRGTRPYPFRTRLPTGNSLRSRHCDEYPFASTKQGAGMQDANYSIQAVPKDENLLHGDALNRFYSDYHVVPGEEFWVKIVS